MTPFEYIRILISSDFIDDDITEVRKEFLKQSNLWLINRHNHILMFVDVEYQIQDKLFLA